MRFTGSAVGDLVAMACAVLIAGSLLNIAVTVLR